MAQLLVSVRSADEVEPALAGGAALIDVKEPAGGPLGRADDAVVAQVVRAVGGRCPVSAALGELRSLGVRSQGSGVSRACPILTPDSCPLTPVGEGFRRCAYLKPGLARYDVHDWRGELESAARHFGALAAGGAEVVTVAYADWQAARAPPVEEVCAFARRRGGVLLIDTFTKPAPGGRGPTLLDCVPLPRLLLLCRLCRAAGVRVALAGSLGPAEIARLLPLEPDWFAVRGAACVDGERGSVIDEGRVRHLARQVAGR
jgi:uncharacterized protein (UPF0264 family)